VNTYFISDLHLGDQQPQLTELFTDFLQRGLQRAESLYILGDLFEVWAGDDDLTSLHQSIIDRLRALTEGGVAVYLLHGNRDFLLSSTFEKLTGARILSEPATVELHGQTTLLLHGDTLCVDDTEYQQFRTRVRDHEWQRRFLALPLEQRREIAHQAREQSSQRTAGMAAEIMDVNLGEVRSVMRQHGVWSLIHGHTHRPGIHYFALEGHAARRIVLGDWNDRGSVLVCDSAQWQLVNWPTNGCSVTEDHTPTRA
jgi:UDP-2,3-diacylglucosamine hydrolase